jgi:16S rRNA (uracil1498-N3)-methyltransferase
MIRLFLPPEQLTSKQIIITGDQARYLSLVLRVKPGDILTVFDGLGYQHTCKILQSHKKKVIAERTKKEPYSVESPISIILAQGIPKGDKMDLIIQKSTELGVRKIIPLITERSQIRYTQKIDRWRKIALSASQQCGRNKIPEIDEPTEFKEFLKQTRGELGIIFSEEEKDRNLKKIMSTFRNTQQIILFIGPEGGFSREEVAIATEKGFITASLGPRILRTETAPITAISIIQYELGDIG